MEQLILSAKYLTEIPSVDEQHQKLVGMLNALNKVIEEKQDEGKVLTIAEEFVTYTKYHFSDEERIMEENEYPDLGSHCQIHMDIIDNVSDTLLQHKGSKMLRYKFFQIGMDILMNHIEIEDNKFATFMKEKNL